MEEERENRLDVIGHDFLWHVLYQCLDQVKSLVVVGLGRDQFLEDAQERFQLVRGDNLLRAT